MQPVMRSVMRPVSGETTRRALGVINLITPPDKPLSLATRRLLGLGTGIESPRVINLVTPPGRVVNSYTRALVARRAA